MATTAQIAFIISQQNEEETIKFCQSMKSQLNTAKIIVTKTEKNKLENVLDKKNLQAVPSVDLQGDKTVANKASRGEFIALIYLSPPADTAFQSRLFELLFSCVKKHIYLAFNVETAESVITFLHGKGLLKGGASSSSASSAATSTPDAIDSKSIARQPSVAVQQLLRSQTVAEKEKTKKVVNWSKQQLFYWFESNELEYLKPLFSDDNKESATEETSMFEKHEQKNNMIVVKSGEPDKLVENVLALPKDAALKDIMDFDDFVRDWFMTFHCFNPPRDFLKQLKSKYINSQEEGSDKEEAQEIKEAVLNILMMWIELEKGADFYEDADLTRDFNEFVELIAQSDKAKASELKDMLADAIKMLKDPPEVDLRNAPAPLLTKTKKGTTGTNTNVPPSIVDIEPLEIARQITLMESTLLRKVRAKEFHGTAWTKKNAEEIAPNLTKVINLSNHISNWMVTELLRLKTIEEMTELIIKFIKVGKHMMQMNNWSGVMEVVTAMTNAAVNKLKQAWAAVPAKTKEMLDELTDITSPLGHYKKYRDAFKSRNLDEPCLPILAATLSDLNGYEEVFATKIEIAGSSVKHVNWRKMSKVADRIWENVSLNCIYPIRPVPELITYIENAPVWKDSLTTCAIADLRMKEIGKQNEQKEASKKNKRKSTSSMSLTVDLGDGPKDELSERDWSILLTGTQPIKFTNGKVILKAGVPNEHLFRIKSGTVKVVKEIDGNEVTVASMGENAMFGEVSMLMRSQKGTTTASIIADGDVEIWRLEVEFVLKMLESKPHLAEKLNRILAIKLARRLRDLGKKPAGNAPPKKEEESLKDSRGDKTSEKAPGGKRSSDRIDDAAKKAEAAAKEEKKEEKKDKSPDAKFNKRFGLEGEVIIKEIECSYKGNGTSHGSLIVSQNFVCFDFGMFGFKIKEAISFGQIAEITKGGKKFIKIQLKSEKAEAEGKVHVLTAFENREEAFTFIRTIWKHQQSTDKKPTKKASQRKQESAQPEEKNKWLPDQEDWDLILKGARTVIFKKDDVVIREGEQFRRIFQLNRGECRFEKMIDGKNKVLGKMGKENKDDSLFGEISFLEGGKASASVVCDKDETSISIIEGYFLEVLFEYYPDLSGRFYHYLAHVLSKRLKQRESGNNPAPKMNDSGGHSTTPTVTGSGKGSVRKKASKTNTPEPEVKPKPKLKSGDSSRSLGSPSQSSNSATTSSESDDKK